MSNINYSEIFNNYSLQDIYNLIQGHYVNFSKKTLENERQNNFNELLSIFNYDDTIKDNELGEYFIDELFKIFEETMIKKYQGKIKKIRTDVLNEIEQTVNEKSTNIFDKLIYEDLDNKSISEPIKVPRENEYELNTFIKQFKEYIDEVKKENPYIVLKLKLDNGASKYVVVNLLSGKKFFDKLLKDKLNIENENLEDNYMSDTIVNAPDIDTVNEIQIIIYQNLKQKTYLEGGFCKFLNRNPILSNFSKQLGIYSSISEIEKEPCLIASIRKINELNQNNKNILSENEINELYLSAFKNNNYITSSSLGLIANEYNIAFKVHYIYDDKTIKIKVINDNKNIRFIYEIIIYNNHIMPYIKLDCSGRFIANFSEILIYCNEKKYNVRDYYYTYNIKRKDNKIYSCLSSKDKCKLINSLDYILLLSKNYLLKPINKLNSNETDIEVRLRNECKEKINTIYDNPNITKQNNKLLKDILNKSSNHMKYIFCIYADIESCFKDNEHVPFMICYKIVEYDNNKYKLIKVFEHIRLIIKDILLNHIENQNENNIDNDFEKLVNKHILFNQLYNNNIEINKEQYTNYESKIAFINELAKIYNENSNIYKDLINKYNESNNYNVIESNTIYSFNCCERLLAKYSMIISEQCSKYNLSRQELADRSICYFHNLGYDGRFFLKYNLNHVINKGKRFINESIKYNGLILKFKDSYSLLTMKLERFPNTFPSAFKDEKIHKEVFPYRYYTYERVEKAIKAHLMSELDKLNNKQVKRTGNTGIITEALQYIDSKNKQNEFINNLKNIFNINESENTFDMIDYCKFYCMQDVNILMKGFEEFRKICLIYPINIDVHKCLTAPSLANKYFTERVYSKINNYYYFNGSIQHYFMKAIYGGRCMSRDNKVWNLKNVKLDDFDACSLYPSAMARMYLPTGKPIEINTKANNIMLYSKVKTYNKSNEPNLLKYCMDINQKYPNKNKFISYFVIEIQIINIGIKRHFPLIIKKDKKGNNYVNECVNMYVDLIMLQDLIKFQDITYKILNGYYFIGIKDFRIRHTIRELYNMRLEYKKNKNPLQEVIKLIMNSSYGKTIQKPIENSIKGKSKDKLNDYIIKHYYSIIGITEFNFDNIIERRIDETGNYNIQPIKNDYNTVLIKESKPIVNQFNNCIAGIIILSMSKRIMNEVICLAEDLDIKIYYQDTDSMHIEHDKINLLASEYKKLYNRELIGKDMGQFHNDFDELPNGYSTELIILGKKMYVDRLYDDSNNTNIHYRMKGIPQDVVKYYAKQEHEKVTNEIDQIIKLYEDIYNGATKQMNICINNEMFNMEMNGKITSIKQFIREVRKTGLDN